MQLLYLSNFSFHRIGKLVVNPFWVVVKKFCASKKYLGGHNQIPKHNDVNFSMIQSRLAPQVIRSDMLNSSDKNLVKEKYLT